MLTERNDFSNIAMRRVTLRFVEGMKTQKQFAIVQWCAFWKGTTTTTGEHYRGVAKQYPTNISSNNFLQMYICPRVIQ